MGHWFYLPHRSVVLGEACRLSPLCSLMEICTKVSNDDIVDGVCFGRCFHGGVGVLSDGMKK